MNSIRDSTYMLVRDIDIITKNIGNVFCLIANEKYLTHLDKKCTLFTIFLI